MSPLRKKISLPASIELTSFAGPNEEYLRLIESYFHISLTLRHNDVLLEGSEADILLVERLVQIMIKQIDSHTEPLNASSVTSLISQLKNDALSPDTLFSDIVYSFKGRVIRPKTSGQHRFVEAIRNNTITFGLGPAGTGKTYLACAMALAALKRHEVSRLVLTRPIVEAGESLGFLPGTMMEKVDPYIRPLYDAIFEMLDYEEATRYIDQGIIEITPLAFMRGRTFNDSFVILDEAQNITTAQMKMFLTRLGFASKMIITGDESQSDNSSGPAGILSAREKLSQIDSIAFCELHSFDVVRHSLVAEIIEAYKED